MKQKKINTKIFEDYMKENNLTITQFCKKCKISLNFYSKMLFNDGAIDLVSLFKISKATNINVSDMFE